MKTEREKAEADARAFGVGYLVNGKRVDPVEVIVVQRAKVEQEPEYKRTRTNCPICEGDCGQCGNPNI